MAHFSYCIINDCLPGDNHNITTRQVICYRFGGQVVIIGFLFKHPAIFSGLPQSVYKGKMTDHAGVLLLCLSLDNLEGIATPPIIVNFY